MSEGPWTITGGEAGPMEAGEAEPGAAERKPGVGGMGGQGW